MRAVVLLIVLALIGYLAREPIGRLVYAVRLSAAPLPAQLDVPVEGVSRMKLRDSWHAQRGTRKHEGIDIFAPCGKPVRSATEGIVTKVGENKLGGQVVHVLGPGGSWHYYAHLSAFADVKRGEIVRAGDLLGYVGNTGNARGTPCHLHYGLYLGGKASNPYALLSSPRSPG